ncbi:MAG TPA: multiheme c-type cytochrome [Rhizomicrobium sp.]|nr:multiheme c-type cytochrome [Rhizomicrobium sp.]
MRQNEITTWQDESSSFGAHSRAWRVLTHPRGEAISARLGLGPAEKAPDCLGCHSDNAGARGQNFQVTDGVGCEACHGGSGAWLAPHYAVATTHKKNVALGMAPLENPEERAKVCLDCHFGSGKAGQFLTHKMMAAGHPRILFELGLFTALQQHHDEDADYALRKTLAGGSNLWAAGQAVALGRALSLYAGGPHSQEGSFPEFYFFDCQSCHRSIYDDPTRALTAIANPGRPLPTGTPPFNDENIIMLLAAARATAPDMATRLEDKSKAFHAAIARDGISARAAAQDLRRLTQELASRFAGAKFDRQNMFAILFAITGERLADRYTDYEGAAQAVMSIDTLLAALLSAKQISQAQAQSMRPEISELYRIVRDPNAYRPAEYRTALARVAAALRRIQ